MKNRTDLSTMRSLTKKVMGLYVSGFLEPNMTTSHVITVFDLIEQNTGGKARLKRLIDEELTISLTPQQFEQATELLEDYPSNKVEF